MGIRSPSESREWSDSRKKAADRQGNGEEIRRQKALFWRHTYPQNSYFVNLLLAKKLFSTASKDLNFLPLSSARKNSNSDVSNLIHSISLLLTVKDALFHTFNLNCEIIKSYTDYKTPEWLSTDDDIQWERRYVGRMRNRWRHQTDESKKSKLWLNTWMWQDTLKTRLECELGLKLNSMDGFLYGEKHQLCSLYNKDGCRETSVCMLNRLCMVCPTKVRLPAEYIILSATSSGFPVGPTQPVFPTWT
jgi:hypothetical protein